jgi:hypothetical protein
MPSTQMLQWLKQPNAIKAPAESGPNVLVIVTNRRSTGFAGDFAMQVASTLSDEQIETLAKRAAIKRGVSPEQWEKSWQWAKAENAPQPTELPTKRKRRD